MGGGGCRQGQDRGHCPATEDKAGLLTNSKGHSLPVEGLACPRAARSLSPRVQE